ncbi:TPA: hypothetical protein R1670_000527 [Campylobacter coli]|nr:hypothetical protein [Campylobacter coli]HEF2147457.1 hypothetical protein [Campylobacter coli]
MDILVSILSGLLGGFFGGCFVLSLRFNKKTRKNINKVSQKLISFLNFGNIKQKNSNK